MQARFAIQTLVQTDAEWEKHVIQIAVHAFQLLHRQQIVETAFWNTVRIVMMAGTALRGTTSDPDVPLSPYAMIVAPSAFVRRRGAMDVARYAHLKNASLLAPIHRLITTTYHFTILFPQRLPEGPIHEILSGLMIGTESTMIFTQRSARQTKLMKLHLLDQTITSQKTLPTLHPSGKQYSQFHRMVITHST